MKLQASATLAALVAIASAQLGDIPPCAMDCFTSAIGKSSCSILDAYCQCTTDAQQISTDALSCICNDSTCSAQERADVQDATNEICSSALAAESETFTPQTYPTNICQQLATGGAGSGTQTAASNSATPTGASGGSGAGSVADGASSSSSTGAAAPAATKMGMVAYEGAVLGLAGIAMLTL